MHTKPLTDAAFLALAFFFWHRSAIYSPQAGRIKSQRIAAVNGDLPRGFDGYAGRLPSLSYLQKLTWTDRVEYQLSPLKIYRHGYV
jgi:hypothetical protein